MPMLRQAVRPIPLELVETCRALLNWVQDQPEVKRLFIYGRGFLEPHSGAEIELAVDLELGEDANLVSTLATKKPAWESELALHYKVNAQISILHPRADPIAWRRVLDGCGLLYDRARPLQPRAPEAAAPVNVA